MDIDLRALANRSGEWLKGAGPESDIVISSRIRLARNLADHPFIGKATELDRAEIEKSFRGQVELLQKSGELHYLDVNELDGLDRQFLVERQLISREHAESHGARGVAIDPGERVSLMINEEDHLRIQVMHSGFDLESAWQRIDAIDDLLESKVTYAFHARLGYLTACPTNVGTGMRVSVMLHLPALVITRQIEKVFRSLHKISLAVRGLYGEGSQAMGDFYQISNQITLGKSEVDLIKQVADVVPVLINYERRARDFLMRESHENLHDRVSRAFGILSTAQTISSEETMHLLSSVRMGVELGLLPELPMPKVNELFIQTQPAHLQKISGGELDSADRNVARAKFLRRHLGNREGSSGHEQN
ncbi:MAG: protein arginine kinase [Pirellulales bacterium]